MELAPDAMGGAQVSPLVYLGVAAAAVLIARRGGAAAASSAAEKEPTAAAAAELGAVVRPGFNTLAGVRSILGTQVWQGFRRNGAAQTAFRGGVAPPRIVSATGLMLVDTRPDFDDTSKFPTEILSAWFPNKLFTPFAWGITTHRWGWGVIENIVLDSDGVAWVDYPAPEDHRRVSLSRNWLANQMTIEWSATGKTAATSGILWRANASRVVLVGEGWEYRGIGESALREARPIDDVERGQYDAMRQAAGEIASLRW